MLNPLHKFFVFSMWKNSSVLIYHILLGSMCRFTCNSACFYFTYDFNMDLLNLRNPRTCIQEPLWNYKWHSRWITNLHYLFFIASQLQLEFIERLTLGMNSQVTVFQKSREHDVMKSLIWLPLIWVFILQLFNSDALLFSEVSGIDVILINNKEDVHMVGMHKTQQMFTITVNALMKCI